MRIFKLSCDACKKEVAYEDLFKVRISTVDHDDFSIDSPHASLKAVPSFMEICRQCLEAHDVEVSSMTGKTGKHLIAGIVDTTKPTPKEGGAL